MLHAALTASLAPTNGRTACAKEERQRCAHAPTDECLAGTAATLHKWAVPTFEKQGPRAMPGKGLTVSLSCGLTAANPEDR